MTQKYDNFINGQWLSSDNYEPNINPSDINDVIGLYAQASAAQTELAIQSAKNAFTTWSVSGIQARHDCLMFVANELKARSAEIGDLLAREEGKTKAEGIGETMRAAQIFDFFAGEVLRLAGEKLPSTRPGLDVEVTREALGVIGIITPWNFPIAIPAWKIAPALAYGNTVVFKPAELAPGCAWTLIDIISRAGFPKGAVNMLMGTGRSVGQTLLDHKDISAVTFTGSVATGSKVAAACTARHAKFQLEMGGKNPMIVLDDADLENAVACAINGAYFSTGQRCTASSRIIVTAGIYDKFVATMTEKTRALVVGDARAEGTQIGPVVNAAQLEKNLEYVEIAKREGANLVCGGDRIELDKPGFYMQPALFIDTNNEMQINKEEVFGPVATIIKANDYEEALAIANDTPFGLAAGICTASLKMATDFKRRSQAGMVMVNLPTAGVDYHVPFGGRKGSSYGAREQGKYAAEFYTTVKTAYTLAI